MLLCLARSWRSELGEAIDSSRLRLAGCGLRVARSRLLQTCAHSCMLLLLLLWVWQQLAGVVVVVVSAVVVMSESKRNCESRTLAELARVGFRFRISICSCNLMQTGNAIALSANPWQIRVSDANANEKNGPRPALRLPRVDCCDQFAR